MKINCSINGRDTPKEQAKISVFDNALFYADGLFETLLALGDRVVFLEDHLDRLEKGAGLIRIELPCPREKIASWIDTANRKNSAKVKKIRVTVTAGDSAFWAGKASKPRIIVIATEYQLPTQSFRLTVSPYRIDHGSPFRNVKTLSFVIEMTSRKRAYSSEYDDGIMLNRAGNVAETTSANIFWVKKGSLYTTPLGAGCLEGMTRKHILQLARRNRIAASVRNVRLKELVQADEIFITSSIKLIRPVQSVTTDRLYRYEIGPLTRRLQQLLWDEITKGR
jgi:branched-subunit amino acid aminotransferase/4-amino-4-deoxychorismate lyase